MEVNWVLPPPLGATMGVGGGGFIINAAFHIQHNFRFQLSGRAPVECSGCLLKLRPPSISPDPIRQPVPGRVCDIHRERDMSLLVLILATGMGWGGGVTSASLNSGKFFLRCRGIVASPVAIGTRVCETRFLGLPVALPAPKAWRVKLLFNFFNLKFAAPCCCTSTQLSTMKYWAAL